MPRSLYDPTVLMVVAAGMSLVGGAMQAADARSNAEAEAAYLEAEAQQSRKQTARDREDLKKEESRLQSRARAILAAGGGGTTGGSALALLTGNAQEYGIKDARLEDDMNAGVSSLEARATNTRRQGERAAQSAIFGGATRAVGLFAQSRTLKAPTTPKTTPGPTYGPYGKNGLRPY